MTEKQRQEKIKSIKDQLAAIEVKFGRLKIQADRLTDRLEELQRMEIKESKIPTEEERKAQAKRDRQREYELLQQFVADGTLDGDLLKMALKPEASPATEES